MGEEVVVDAEDERLRLLVAAQVLEREDGEDGLGAGGSGSASRNQVDATSATSAIEIPRPAGTSRGGGSSAPGIRPHRRRLPPRRSAFRLALVPHPTAARSRAAST